MSVDPRFDDMLFAILNNVGQIDNFLDIVFSFLYRRTDFFKVKRSKEEKLGLPPGVASKIVKAISQRYIQVETARMARIDSESGPASATEGKAEKSAATEGKAEKSAATEGKAEKSAATEGKAEKSEGKAVKSPEKNSVTEKEKNNSDSSNVVQASQDHDLSKQDSNHNKQGDTHKNEKEEVKTDTVDKEKSVESSSITSEQKQAEGAKEEEERRYYTSNPESYNGASYDNYSWSQNNFELDVHVKVPNGVKGGNQVKILVEKTHLKVEALQDEEWQTLLDGTLLYEVKIKSSTWTLHPNDHVHVNLEKGYPRYWEALLESEPKINVRTIDCSIPFEDIDDEAQAKLQQMMFDQHQKRLGKPTSEEIKVQEMLKQAWNQKGSPFRGQKFDPSVINLPQ